MNRLTWRVIEGDNAQRLATLPDGCVHTCITSPPYWGLRDYGVDGQIGLEETPEEHIARLVEVFRQVRRVLRDDGTLWVNYGDAYAGSRKGGYVGTKSTLSSVEGQDQSRLAAARMTQSRRRDDAEIPRSDLAVAGLKCKDLIGLPWLLAFALRADGWYFRQDIIWHKPNPMPESVTDRCTKAHEYLFLLSKGPRYFYDAAAIYEPVSGNAHSRGTGVNPKAAATEMGQRGQPKQNGSFSAAVNAVDTGKRGDDGGMARNRRSVWTVATQPFPEAHFATFPEALVEPCVKAGSPLGGLVLDPFSGSGTTGVVALKQGRSYVGCELNPEYVQMSRRRLGEVAPLLAEELVNA